MEIKEPEQVRRHLAYHESGHVIADLVFGYRFTFVTIRPDDSGEYEGMVYGSTRGRARDLAVVQLAGIAASAKMAGSDPWETLPRFDDDNVDITTAGIFIDNWVAFLSRTYGESSYKEQLGDETKEKTRLLVDQNWKPIEVIAGALLEQENLSYDDVIRILKEQCPDFTLGGKS
ncbi:MAG: hypothetical protein M0Q91_14805 [Methanoregula sp.]|jgi:hypothetical protein|nr:hypothetical protein [Methanoregula sp.]